MINIFMELIFYYFATIILTKSLFSILAKYSPQFCCIMYLCMRAIFLHYIFRCLPLYY